MFFQDVLKASVLGKAAHRGGVLGVRFVSTDEDEISPWLYSPSGRSPEFKIKGPLPDKVDLVLGNQIYISKEGLPSSLENRIVRLAAFQNPEFYKAQAMRFPIYDKPRIVHCCEDFQKYIGLPRGCLGSFLDGPDKQIGQVGGGKRKPTGIIDVAMIQSLSRKGVVDDIVADYGHLIVDDVLAAISQNRFPVILTERKRHLDILKDLLDSQIQNVIVMKGGMGKKQRKAALTALQQLADDDEKVVLATGRS